MKRKKFGFMKEFAQWLHPRFSLTDGEKYAVLLILLILWAGLTARLLQLRNDATLRAFEGTAGLQSGPIEHKVEE